MAQLLDFPDELLCGIFEYLSAFDALHSFLNLNNRFNRLLRPFKQQIDLTYLFYDEATYYINILLPILRQDGSLNAMKLGNKRTPGQIKLFNTLISDENQRDYFNYLEKIVLESPRLDELIEFVDQYLLSLPNLSVLVIQIDYIRDEDFRRLIQLIIHSILSMTNLIKLSIEIPTGLVLSHLSNTIIFHSLIYVKLNLSLVTDLLILIPRIPNVEILSICISWWTSGDRTLTKMLDEMNSTNNNQTSFFNHLKKFHLTINSILTFQPEHLEQVLLRIMNQLTTSSLTFVLRHGFNQTNESMKLIDGQYWEKILRRYSLLIQLNLSIRINGVLEKEQILKLNLFKSKYFIEKNWTFSYSKYLIKNNTIFYSIPYRNIESFDILINDDVLKNNCSVNYTPVLSIHQSNQLALDFILKYFPYLQELSLDYLDINSSMINPLNIPSLHTLKIGKERPINLHHLLQLFPLINTLFLSYFTLNDRNQSFAIYPYNRIIELSLSDISEDHLNEILIFLNQFPNLHFLHIHINNRRMTNEELVIHINQILRNFPSLIYLKLQLGKDPQSAIQWTEELNNRIKMRFTDVIFEGILIHFWF